jgi:hypothetical protein
MMSPWGWTRIKGLKHVGQYYTINVIKLYICRTINIELKCTKLIILSSFHCNSAECYLRFLRWKAPSSYAIHDAKRYQWRNMSVLNIARSYSSLIPYFILRQFHSFFQSEFSTKCNLVRHFSISSRSYTLLIIQIFKGYLSRYWWCFCDRHFISSCWESLSRSCFYSSLRCLNLHTSSKFMQLLSSLLDWNLEVPWSRVSQPTDKFVLEKLIVEFTDFRSDAGENSILVGYCLLSPGVCCPRFWECGVASYSRVWGPMKN